METAMELIEQAREEGRTVLSEYESKKVLEQYGIPVTKELLVAGEKELMQALRHITYPVVLKGCAPEFAHKTEQQMVVVDVRNDLEATEAFSAINRAMKGIDGRVLVQEYVKGPRELMVGMIRDPQFGPCVMFGLGGIFTEILRDVSFRLAPIDQREAVEMMREIKGHKILDAIRGMMAADQEKLAEILIRVGQIGLDYPAVKEIDINPLIIAGSDPIAVDALVVVSWDS
jgi:succinyl-CoA synthetase beta subunit